MTLPTAGAAAVLLAAIAMGSPAQETWGCRSIEKRGHTVVIDEWPSTFMIDVCDWSIFDSKPEDIVVHPTLRDLLGAERFAPTVLRSLAMLEASAKRFDDSLYAAIDFLVQRGWTGPNTGKRAFLDRLREQIATSESEAGEDSRPKDEALARLWAARRLLETATSIPPDMQARVDLLIVEFDSEPSRSKPIGFYTWSPALASLFRQDRFHQEVADLAGPQGAWLLVIAQALAEDHKLADTYRTLLRIPSTMTNALVAKPLIDLGPNRSGKVALFPASRSHEGDLLAKLYCNRPIPDGHAFMDDLVAAIREGRIDLKPTPASGWYDHQTFALEPLLRPEAAEESSKVRRGPGYVRHCEEVFRSALTRRRETHAKQVDGPMFGASGGIWISPTLSVEPQITVLARTAAAYGFIREALLKIFGRDVLAKTRLVLENGGEGGSVLEGLEQMEERFLGLAALSCHEIGCTPAIISLGLTKEEALKLAARARAELVKPLSADELAYDPRVLVPVGYDQVHQEVRCWGVVGFAPRDLKVEYETEPFVSVRNKEGEPSGGENRDVRFTSAVYQVPYEVWIECSLKEPLTRDEFRKLCGSCRTLSEIKKALGAVK